MSRCLFSQLHLWTFGCRVRLVCPDTVFINHVERLTMWYVQQWIAAPHPPPHPSISNSIIEPSCCIVGSLACNASAVYSVYWGAAWQFQLSPETHWKAFLLKINPVHPRPASQPCRPCAACRLASPSPLIHCSVPFMQKPSYGCARAGAGAFKPSATHALSLRHTQTQIKTQRKHIYKKNTQIVPPRTACSCTSVHSLYRKTLNLWTCKSQTACTWSSPVHHISNSMIGF